MIALQIIALLLVALAGLAVVLNRDPVRQAIALSFHGATLTFLFLILQAPDVAFSEIAVGSAVLPLILLATVAKVRGGQKR